MQSDLVITGVRVRTGRRPGQPGADPGLDAIALRGGRILAIGGQDDVLVAAGRASRRLHLPGHSVLPGFQDAHVHPAFAGRYRLHLSLHDVPTLDGYRTAIASYAASHPERAWIYGSGWAAENVPGGHPSADLLDDLVPDRPVFLLNSSVHEAWVNSAALRLAGITADTPDPADGRYQRDPLTGAPTGLLYEGAAYSFEARHLPRPTGSEWRAALLHSQAHLHTLGITGWQDAWVEPEVLDAYAGLADDGRLTARVVAALWWHRERGLEQIADFVEQRAAGSRPGLLARTVKIMVDGVLENRTGAMLSPYQQSPGHHVAVAGDSGLSYVDPDLLAAAVTELDRLDFQVHLHAIGDRAVRTGLNAVQAARAGNGPRGNRHHLAHIQVIQPDDVPRFAALGAVANCQAYWAKNDPMMELLTIPVIGPERAALQYPFAALAASGARLAMGSDWPVTTADPLAQIEVATTRTDPRRRDATPFRPDQRLPLATALQAFTAGSAYVNHDDEAAGLTEGGRADLVVLEGDLLDGAPPADCRVRYTIASGRIVHSPSDAPV